MPPFPRYLALLLCALWAGAACAPSEPQQRIEIHRLTPTTEVAAARIPTVTVTRAAATQTATAVATPSPSAAPTATAAGTSGPRLAPPAQVVPAPVLRPAQGSGDPVLVRVIEDALGADAAGASVFVRRLTDGTTAEWQSDRVHYAASLYKLEVLYEAFRQRRLGTLDFERTVPVADRYANEDLGTLSRLPRAPDGGLEIAEAVRGMVTLSDNTSATILLDVLGHRNIDATMASLGLAHSSVNTTELPTTAADMARLMEAIVRGEGLDPSAAQEMVQLLLAQETRAGIPRGLPAGVPAGNKTGTWPGATHDVAVVLAPGGAYVIAVLTEGSWAWEPITRVSRAVYDYFSTSQQSAGGR
jgi:beta-lactamase class A